MVETKDEMRYIPPPPPSVETSPKQKMIKVIKIINVIMSSNMSGVLG